MRQVILIAIAALVAVPGWVSAQDSADSEAEILQCDNSVRTIDQNTEIADGLIATYTVDDVVIIKDYYRELEGAPFSDDMQIFVEGVWYSYRSIDQPTWVQNMSAIMGTYGGPSLSQLDECVATPLDY